MVSPHTSQMAMATIHASPLSLIFLIFIGCVGYIFVKHETYANFILFARSGLDSRPQNGRHENAISVQCLLTIIIIIQTQ